MYIYLNYLGGILCRPYIVVMQRVFALASIYDVAPQSNDQSMLGESFKPCISYECVVLLTCL